MPGEKEVAEMRLAVSEVRLRNTFVKLRSLSQEESIEKLMMILSVDT